MIQFRDIQIQSIPSIPDINHEILTFESDAKIERDFLFSWDGKSMLKDPDQEGR